METDDQERTGERRSRWPLRGRKTPEPNSTPARAQVLSSAALSSSAKSHHRTDDRTSQQRQPTSSRPAEASPLDLYVLSVWFGRCPVSWMSRDGRRSLSADLLLRLRRQLPAPSPSGVRCPRRRLLLLLRSHQHLPRPPQTASLPSLLRSRLQLLQHQHQPSRHQHRQRSLRIALPARAMQP